MKYCAKIFLTIALALSFLPLNVHANPQKNEFDNLQKEHFNSIMASKTWHIVFNDKTRNIKICSNANRIIFKSFLHSQKRFTQEIIKLLSCPLIDNNLFIVLKRMWELGYSYKMITFFKHFLLALFAAHKYEDIKEFEKSIKNGDEENIKNYLSEGLHPNWIVGINKDMQTGLMLAVNSSNYSIVSLFLKSSSININATNTLGMNALMMSIENKNENIARLLLKKKGWDFWQFSTNKETAIALASIHLPQLEDVIANRFKPYLRFQD